MLHKRQATTAHRLFLSTSSNNIWPVSCSTERIGEIPRLAYLTELDRVEPYQGPAAVRKGLDIDMTCQSGALGIQPGSLRLSIISHRISDRIVEGSTDFQACLSIHRVPRGILEARTVLEGKVACAKLHKHESTLHVRFSKCPYSMLSPER